MSELKPKFEPLLSSDFPFPLAGPQSAPMMITRSCGCTSMTVDDQPVQISWCDNDDPGYTPPTGPLNVGQPGDEATHCWYPEAHCSNPPPESCSDAGCPVHGAENVWGGDPRLSAEDED